MWLHCACGYICVPFRQYVSSCVSATYVLVYKCNTLVKLIRLLASVLHHVNLQSIGESGGSVIVLFAVVWLFSDMPPHHVPS